MGVDSSPTVDLNVLSSQNEDDSQFLTDDEEETPLTDDDTSTIIDEDDDLDFEDDDESDDSEEESGVDYTLLALLATASPSAALLYYLAAREEDSSHSTTEDESSQIDHDSNAFDGELELVDSEADTTMDADVEVIHDSSDDETDDDQTSSDDSDIQLSGVQQMADTEEPEVVIVRPPTVRVLPPGTRVTGPVIDLTQVNFGRRETDMDQSTSASASNRPVPTFFISNTPPPRLPQLRPAEPEDQSASTSAGPEAGPSSADPGADSTLSSTPQSAQPEASTGNEGRSAEPEANSATAGHEAGPSTSRLDTSAADFRSPRRHKPFSPKASTTGVVKATTATASSSATTANNEDSDEEGQVCPICFEAWTNSGNHRLASLKCGHLFGQSCIEKWLRQSGNKCPQCNIKAKRKDIRVIYAKTLKVEDTADKDRALEALESERKARKAAELQTAEMRLSLQLARDENKRLMADMERQRQRLNTYGSQPSGASSIPNSPTKVGHTHRERFTVEKTVKIWEAGGCRVMAYSAFHATLCVSQPSASPLFPGFGIKKLNTLDFRPSQYVALHTKMIRDIAFNPYSNDGLLLSASMDKTVKVTSLAANTVVQTYQCPAPAWSCTWDSDSVHHFYVGAQNGRVYRYDLRNTREHERVLNEGGNTSPAVSLQYVKHNPGKDFRCGGLLVGQLSQSQFLERNLTDDFKLHLLPLERNMTSMCIDDESRHALVTYRPTQAQPTVRHSLYELNNRTDGHTVTCNRTQTFHGGGTQKVLARSRLIPDLGSRGMIVAGDEATQCVHMWDISTGLLHQKVPVQGAVIDLLDLSSRDRRGLVALTDKQVNVMKWS